MTAGVFWPFGRGPLEESPGTMWEGRWITSSGGDPRDSATESRPPRNSW